MLTSIPKPRINNISKYYQTYWKYVPEDNLLDALERQTELTASFLSVIPEKEAAYSYEEGKWLLKEVVGHLCDTERILVYRALRFSRKDQTPVEGFDENTYVPNSNYARRTLQNILEEWECSRRSTLAFFSSLDPEMLDRTGIANKTEVSVRSLLFFIIAHERHHLSVIRERYLTEGM